MSGKEDLLKRYWGYDTFRPLQEDIIDSVAAGHDTLALLPTGGGKSLCYQIPALMAEGLCLVVSPLIALMKDQVQQLNDRKIRAYCLTSGMSGSEIHNTLNNCVSGVVKLLYVSPERLQQRMFIEHLRQMKVSMIAVDEAHCISQWGYNFRPPYLKIAAIRQYHPQAPVLALTATATPAVADDIVRSLQMRDVRCFTASFARPNLHYTVLHDGNKTMRLVHTVENSEGCGIVYTRSRRLTKTLADMLTARGVSATYYHAGLDGKERDRRQGLWMEGKYRVMVSTNAFGMGIDKADVRFVIHADVPESLEAYFQEAGRAGRDGKAARAILLCGTDEGARLAANLEAEYPTPRYVRHVYRAICNYYRLPIGSGAESHFDYDLEGICHTYNFSLHEYYSASRFLERAGLIALPDRADAYSTLFIPLGRDELYRFQVNHMRLGDVVQTLLRMYPGISMAPVDIEERRIAKRCNTDTADLRASLTQLHEMHVVEYHMRSTKPQIIFTSARIDENDINFGEQQYDELKAAARERVQAVQRYLADDGTCRSRQLLAYFGQQTTDDDDCGMCDVCLRRHTTKEGIRNRLLCALEGVRLTVNELKELVDPDGIADVAGTLREMADHGQIHIDADMRISRS